MSERPWGPHGPEVPSHTTTPNPTAASAPPVFGQADEVVAPPQTGGGLGAIIVNIIISLVMLAILWIPAVCLYPLTGAAGIGAALLAMQIFASLLPADAGDIPFVLGVIAGAVAIRYAFRIERRLAGSADFRRIRHIVRLALLAVWAIPIIQLAMGATAPDTTTRYIFAVVSSPRAMAQFLLSPQNLVIWIAAVIGLHFLISKGDRVRRIWHNRLGWVGLK